MADPNFVTTETAPVRVAGIDGLQIDGVVTAVWDTNRSVCDPMFTTIAEPRRRTRTTDRSTTPALGAFNVVCSSASASEFGDDEVGHGAVPDPSRVVPEALRTAIDPRHPSVGVTGARPVPC